MSDHPDFEAMQTAFMAEMVRVAEQAIEQSGLTDVTVSQVSDADSRVMLTWNNAARLSCQVTAMIEMSHDIPWPHVSHIKTDAEFVDEKGHVQRKQYELLNCYATNTDFITDSIAEVLVECNRWTQEDVLADLMTPIDPELLKRFGQQFSLE